MLSWNHARSHLLCSVCTGLLVAATARSVSALVSVGAPDPISAHAFLDDPSRLVIGPGPSDTEGSPSVAGDGTGNWISVWYGTVGPPLGEVGGSAEVWVSRSSDNGRTWTTGIALESVPGFDFRPKVSTDRAGVWIVTWENGQQGVLASRSVDNGQSWTTVFGEPDSAFPDLATDETGVWILATDDTLTQVFVSRSVDGGQTWGTAVALDTDDVGNLLRDDSPDIATDRSGNWIVTWLRGDTIMASRSLDNGVTWDAPLQIGDIGFESGIEGPSVVSNGQGQWLAAWTSRPDVSSDPNADLDIYYAISADNGATWTAAAGLFGPPSAEFTYEDSPTLGAGADGSFYMAFIGYGPNVSAIDIDVFVVRSMDGGSTWTSANSLNLAGRNDGHLFDLHPTLGFDGDRSWIAAWTSENSLGGTIGNDYDILFSRSEDDCPTAPATGCITPTRPGASRLSLKDDLSGGSDRLTWTWSTGGATTLDDLGDPTTTSDYALCLYDDVSGTLRSVFEIDAGAALTCSGDPCWSATSGGFAYGDKGEENGAVRSLALESGEEGRAKIKLKAAGPSVGPPRLPLAMSPSLKVQLHNLETGTCWEATFSTTILNDTTRFKARSD